MKPVGIQLWTVRKDLEARAPEAVLQDIANLGFDGIEGYIDRWSPEEFRRLVGEMGMQVSSYYGPVPTPDKINELADRTKALGTDILTGGFWTQDLESKEAIERSAGIIREAIPALAEQGVRYAMHNHWQEYEVRDGELVMDTFFRACPELYLELDIYWASAFGLHRSEGIVRKYADRVRLMHVKDGPLVQGEPLTALGDGRVDIRACLEAADPEWYIVEIDEVAGEMMPEVAKSIAYLREHGYAK